MTRFSCFYSMVLMGFWQNISWISLVFLSCHGRYKKSCYVKQSNYVSCETFCTLSLFTFPSVKVTYIRILRRFWAWRTEGSKYKTFIPFLLCPWRNMILCYAKHKNLVMPSKHDTSCHDKRWIWFIRSYLCICIVSQ